MQEKLNNKIVMGFWHNWASTDGQGYRGGRFTEMQLTDIPVEYNYIAVAFMRVEPGSNDHIPDFKPYNATIEEFKHQIDVLHSQGRKVLLSLGGADAQIELESSDETAFIDRVIQLTDRYGFDGIDIDLEQAAITAAKNQEVIPAALKLVKAHYRQAGKNFIISMAPEFPYLTEGREYNAYIHALDGEYDFIAPQFYNQGGDGVFVEGLGWIAQNNDAMKTDFLYYLTESLVTGTRGFIRIPADKFIIGLPTNNDAAATGYVINKQNLIDAMERLEEEGHSLAGIMTWSVNWDGGFDENEQPYNWEFIKRYGYMSGNDGNQPEPEVPVPAVPVNIQSPAQTDSTITLTWMPGSGSVTQAESFSVFRDGSLVNTVNALTLLDQGLSASTMYNYQVRANAAGGNSALSEVLKVQTTGNSSGNTPEWELNATYAVGDKVSYAGSIWVCLAAHTAVSIEWAPGKAATLWALA